MLGFDPLHLLPFPEAFALAGDLGLALQIQLEPPTFWFSEEQVEALRDVRATHPAVPLVVHAPYREVFLSSLYEPLRRAALEIVKRSIDLAADLSASLVVFHAGDVNVMAPRDLARGVAAESVREVLEYAEGRGVPVALENAPFYRHSLFLYASDFLSLDVDVPICLDIPHAYAVDALDAYFDLLGDRIVAYHLSDTVRGKDLHAALGEGEIPWKSVLSRLDPEKPWILEVGRKDALLKSLDVLRSLGFYG